MSAAYSSQFIFQPLNYGAYLPFAQLHTYISGTSTPQPVYSDINGTIPFSNPVILDVTGSATFYLGSGLSYRFDLYSSIGVHITDYPIDNITGASGVSSGGSGSGLPSQGGNNGYFLVTNGSAASWSPVSQVPSVTGNPNSMLATNGSTYYWTPITTQINNNLSSSTVYGILSAAGLQVPSIVSSLPSLPNALYPNGTIITLSTNGQLYTNNGGVWANTVNQITAPQLTSILAAGGIAVPAVVSSLPSLPNGAYPVGTIVMLSTTAALYINTANVWVNSAPSITAANITAALGVNGLVVPAVVTSLPGLPNSAYPNGCLVVVSSTGVMWTNNNGTWSNAIAAAQITGNLTSTQIGTGTIIATNIANNSITSGQIAANTINAGNIAANTITGGCIAAGTIGAYNIVSGSITSVQIGAGAITAGNIAAGTITGGLISANTISAGNIVSNSLTSACIAAGAIGASQIAASSITSTQIAAGTITGTNIAGTTITGSNIAAGTITGTNIAGTTITGSNIVGATITGTNIAAGTLTANNIASGTITANQIATNFQLISNTISSSTYQSGMSQGYGGVAKGWAIFAVPTTVQSNMYPYTQSPGTAEFGGGVMIGGQFAATISEFITSNGGGCCVREDTNVLMADNTEKIIKEVKLRDKVMCYDMAEEEYLPIKVIGKTRTIRPSHIKVSTDKTDLYITPDHPMWVPNKGWCIYNPIDQFNIYRAKDQIELNQIQIGDTLIHPDNTTETISGMSPIINEEVMWTLTVKHQDHNFTANGFRIHNGGGGDCISGDTLISTPSGSKQIKDLELNDKIYGYDSDNNKIIRPITAIVEVIHDHTYEITCSDGRKLTISDEHPIATKTGWKTCSHNIRYTRIFGINIEEISPGDEILVEDGKFVEFVSKKRIRGAIELYTLGVSGTSTYIANGLVIHDHYSPI